MARVVIIPVSDKDRWVSLLGADYESICLDSNDVEHIYASYNDVYIPEIEALRDENTVVLIANLTDNRPLKATADAGYTFPPDPDPPPGPPE